MGRINNTTKYPYDTAVSVYDYLIGSDADSVNKRTLNYRILDIANLIVNIIGSFDGGDRVVRGSVFPIGGLNWASTPIIYIYQGTIRIAPARDLITLNEPTSDKRIDVFAVDLVTNSLVVIEGEESANPSEPTVEFGSQIRVSAALLENGETDPDGVSYELVYNEYTGEPTEWTTTKTEAFGGFELDNTDDALVDSTSILGKSLKVGDHLTFTNDSTVDGSTISSLSFGIKNTDVEDLGIKIVLLNGSDIVSSVTYVYNNFYGYSLSNTDWHRVNIPITDFALTDDFDVIRFEFSQLSSDKIDLVRIDDVNLIRGIEIPVGITPDLQEVTDVGATTTNPMTVDAVNNSTVSGLIVQNNSGARSSLGISTDSGDSVGSMSFKNEETLGIAEIYISKDATTPSLLVLPQRPDTTPRVLGVGVTDGSSTSYFNSEGIVDLSSLILPSGDLQAVLEAGEIATFSGAGYSSTVDLDIFNHNITLNTERTGIGYGRLELISSGADSFKLYAGKAGTQEHGIRYDGSGVALFNNDGTTNLEFRLRGGTGGGSVLINTPTLLTSGSYYMPMFFQNSLVTGITANSQGIVDLSTLIAKTTTADTGTVINLANPIGNECNFLSANSNTTFTTTNTGGWAKVLINAASEPTVTGATKEVGGTFIANTDIYLIVQSTADGVKYFWSYKEVLPPTTFTVATLPTGTLGDEAIVTDAIAPTYLGALTGGGAVTCPVWYNGTIWVSR